ncbi:MAG: tRNA uridine-5-carboxymethylaminomethyl(34) synthesis GTPase MnmE [Acidobacteriota bacterium]|nr:tRNA uridine-5-carboxymethylaminomethyl(34) synthesis GTPase MnmE [Acidobacteriota bacterium]
MHDLSETIVAVATPPGRGGVACVRLSGPAAVDVAGVLFRPAQGAIDAEASRAVFGRFVGRDGSSIDHGYAVVFAAGASFTGELTAELWTHGSPAILAELLIAATTAGAVLAGPGEFTYRALRNGRLDLARAEAVRDLVAARTLFQARVAFAQAEGALSRRLAPLREALADLMARTEAAVEFVDESETHLPGRALAEGIERALTACTELLEGFRQGRVVREGATVVITGRPNVGKSSLFNQLLARDRAIVTEIPGTTRDTLEEQIDLDGIPVKLVDTAGLRHVVDPVEGEGVRRARAAREEADVVVVVLDGTSPPNDEERTILAEIAGAPDPARGLVVVNKIDLTEAGDAPLRATGAVRVSARTGEGLDDLRQAMRERLLGAGALEDPILTDVRHARAIDRAREALERGAAAAAKGVSEELVLEDLREAMHNLGSVTGEMGPDELYDRIFSTFCIGK